MISSIVFGEGKFMFLLYQPASEYFFLIKKLNSADEIERLSGYYSLVEYKKIENDFLFERFKMEKPLYIKRSIIWILSFSRDKDDVLKFYSDFYKGSHPEIKKEILRSIKRIDRGCFNRFIKKNRVEKSLLKYVE